jgi:glycosyltransferase involved in cell wall biosynthesis
MARKIHIVTPMRYPVGGIRTYLKYTYGKLDSDRYSFTLVGPSREWLERIKADLWEYEVDSICSVKEEDNLSFFFAIVSAFFGKKPDIIHSQGYTAGTLSSLANCLFRVPHVITMHRVFGQDQFSGTFWEKNARLKRNLIEFFLKQADVVQSVSKDAQANLLKYFPGLLRTPGKARVIRNGINIDEFDDRKRSNTETFNKKAGAFYLGFFGRYMAEKGFSHLIDVMDILVNEKKVNNIRVLCVGGFGAFIREYKKEIRRRVLEEYFKFLGFFDNIAPVLRGIDLLIIPSLSEACGLVGMEGLVCGTPVLAYSCIGLREVLSNTPARMVNVGDRAGLSNEVIAIMDEYASVKAEFDDFVPEARIRFDAGRSARGLEEVFEEVLRRKTED